MPEVNQRELQFETLADAAAEAQRLLLGYESTGNWTLAQVCGHCQNWLTYPMDGFPKPNMFMGGMLWMMKVTVGKGMMRKAIETGKMRAGGPTMPASIPSSDADDKAAVDDFVSTVQRFESFQGKLHPSPLFGENDKDTTTKLHLVHCAHHFSFLKPKN